ncbi:MAG: hypothetical protein AUJ92_14335 [Armatimonadetes bacterium CG2_30_59_28]|nr:archease [Armatimonadota bacterium]OIO92393.1 MAG: hypothetical protein AUJ92_14335 [Armatimonadetes bacterium CG2_30_59_28]PIU63671.1 MAG: protein archease [Armatimonadetes bacterium CG07_land_8_20_14_0_80_59_28]PIX41867.1 MAG: protein archease [Armatimonadetes bacterium CG_4_8_14_3_um_filter_58_9]PIY48771.1 MAG: protein archease [Armatimonadetes bacterium CG_4_10_14_3_um_filter_59_10]PJB67470.1 MAG: protein archease [Armatimonadetes bacterium CG_4_9_14_3_um_filter_58_7]
MTLPTHASFEVADHTADVALRACGDSLAHLFISAARGMFTLIAEGETPGDGYPGEVTVESADWESLLVSWLRELLFRFELHSQLPVDFAIRDISPQRLLAEVQWVNFDPQHHELLRHIKAVTYHGLEVKQTDEGWEATLVFDT